MEPLDSVCLASNTDIVHVEDVECRTPSPVNSCNGSDCSISAARVVATAEAAIEERSDVMLRLMGHLIPVSTEPEEDSASETNTSVLSSASTLKRRLHNLPAPDDAVKLADRVAVLNRRIRKERDLYLHLQGLSNRIEEKDEGDLSTTDSSKTVKLKSNRHQGRISNARARRRERLKSGSATMQRQISSDLQLCSPGLSSPETLTLKEICEDTTGKINRISSPINAHYHSAISGSSMVDALPLGHVGVPNFHLDHANYFEDRLTNFNLSSDLEDPRVQATTSSAASSTGVEYPYVARKRTSMEFGGYRPPSGIIIRNLSSDSESDAIPDRIVRKGLCSQKYRRGHWTDLENHHVGERRQRTPDFISRNCSPNSDGTKEVERFSVEGMEAVEDRLLSPVLLADSGHFFEESNSSRRIETCSELRIPGETRRAPIPSNEKNHHRDRDPRHMVKQNTLVDSNVGHFHNTKSIDESFANLLSEQEDLHISRNITYDTSTENSLKPVHYLNLSKKSYSDILPSLRSTEALIPGEECSRCCGSEGVELPMPKSSAKVYRVTNHQSVPVSSRPWSGSVRNSECLGNHDSNDDIVHPKIPPLEIDSQNCSQSHSLSSDGNGHAKGGSSLDVNALIQALSDVSLKRRNSMNSRNRSMSELKSPLGYGNRFSGSSGPRSSEYTPAAGGSRQSLTSLEASEAHSMQISRGELTTRRQAAPFLKYDERSTGSTSRMKISEALSGPPANIQHMAKDSLQESRFVPVVPKINKTNLICSKQQLSPKLVAKLISPRKYPNADFRGVIADHLTSRTDVSQSSGRSRESFRSLQSGQHGTKVYKKEFDGSQPKTGLSVPLSGRRVLEPLDSVPKIKLDSLTGVNRKLKRGEKSGSGSSGIIRSQSKTCSERTTSANSGRQSSRRSSPRFAQCSVNLKRSTVRDDGILNGEIMRGEPSPAQNHKIWKNSIKGKKASGLSSGNILHLDLDRPSLSSGDCNIKNSWSPLPRDENSTETDNAYDSEDRSYDQPRPISESYGRMSAAVGEDAQCIGSLNLADTLAGSSGICVHANDLRDGREVILPCGNTKCQEDSISGTELFKRLPKEIFGSLTRHASLDTKVTENLHPTQETTSTIENLSRSIQKNNDKWIKNIEGNDDLGIAHSESADDKASSTDSFVPCKKSQLQNPLLNRSKIPQRIRRLPVHDSSRSQLRLQHAAESAGPPHSRNRVSEEISPDTSPSFGDRRQESEHKSEPDQLDSRESSLIQSGPNSYQNTHRSVAESVDDDHEVSGRDLACEMTDQSVIEEVTSNTMQETIVQENSPETPVLVDPFDSTSRYLSKCNNDGIEVCGKVSSPGSTRSENHQTVSQHPQDGVVSSSLSIETSSSMSKLNSIAEAKWDVTVTAGVNSVKKSQDRFPFTMSESTSRKTSTFKVAADVNLDQLIQDQNAQAKPADQVSAKNLTLAKSGDREIPIGRVDAMKETEKREHSKTPQLTPFLEKFASKISHDSPENRDPQIPFTGSNYISYGCREVPRALMPTVKDMMKKLSAKLRYTRTKQCQDDPKGTEIEILYRNINCRCESGEGSSTAASLYQSQLFSINSKVDQNSVRRSNDGSRASSGREIRPKRNHECIGMSMQQSPRKGCNQDDLWIQELDFDPEFDTLPAPTIPHSQKPNESFAKVIPTNSPANDRYSMFLARGKLSRIMNEADLKCCEGGDSEKVRCRSGGVDGLFSKVSQTFLESPRTMANFSNEFRVDLRDGSLGDSFATSGCCCFNIYHYFIKSKRRGRKTRRRLKI